MANIKSHRERPQEYPGMILFAKGKNKFIAMAHNYGGKKYIRFPKIFGK